MHVVQICDCHPQWLNASGGAILSSAQGDINSFGPVKAPFNIIVGLRGPLTKIRPVGRRVREAIFVGTLSAPYYAGGRPTGVETCMRTVTLVSISELAMNA